MTTELIELIKQFISFNSTSEHKISMKEYLIKELNYNEEDANNINEIYNLEMKYS